METYLENTTNAIRPNQVGNPTNEIRPNRVGYGASWPLNPEPTPFPYDASYEGYPKGDVKPLEPEAWLERWHQYAGRSALLGGVALAVALIHLLGWRALLAGVLLLALGALCGGGIVYLIFRGDEEIGVE